MTAWNTANAGNNWNFVETTTPANADISIDEEQPNPGATGTSYPHTTPTGLFGLGAGKLDSVHVAVKPGLSVAERDRTIIHELGHCLRLNHTPGATDVMNKSNTATTPSANDIAEANASDKDPPCPYAAMRNAVRGQNTVIDLVPKPGSGIDLTDVLQVEIFSLTGPEIYVDPDSITWDADGITATFEVTYNADHNEVFNVNMVYSDTILDYTGVLTVTDDDPQPGMYPHAVAGNDTTITAGTWATLDGQNSYHDDPSVFYSGTWLTSAGPGIFDIYGRVMLPPGQHIAVLQVMDYYGQVSLDTIAVTVTGSPIPTLTEWGMIIFCVLLFGWMAWIIVLRKKKVTVGL